MIEISGDIWEVATEDPNLSHSIAITTNGYVKMDGCAVMGRGIARQARDKFPGLDLLLGTNIRMFGNIPCYLGEHTTDDPDPVTYSLYSFPVKHHWKDKADIKLITRSAEILAAMFAGGWLYTVRPGCGNGGLDWVEVKNIITPIFDDRFIVVEW